MFYRVNVSFAPVLVLTLMVGGCASTDIHSQVDPQVRGHAFHKIAVVVTFQDMALRQETERKVQSTLASHGVQAVPSLDLLFQGRQYTPEETHQVLVDAGIEAVLTISSAGAGTSSTWIPPRTTTQGSVTLDGNTASGTATTTTTPGRSIDKPWANFEARLRDTNSKAVVWVAQMSSGGNAFAGWDNLARSMAKKTSEQLLADRIVK